LPKKSKFLSDYNSPADTARDAFTPSDDMGIHVHQIKESWIVLGFVVFVNDVKSGRDFEICSPFRQDLGLILKGQFSVSRNETKLKFAPLETWLAF